MSTLFFIDTEFVESGSQYPLHLMSIGIVSAQGDQYYAESLECPHNLASPWVREHVFPHLRWKDVKPNKQIREEIFSFVTGCCEVPPKPEFWGYFSSYDWVIFCQIFGTMMNLPKEWPLIAYDLRQWLDHKGLINVRQPDDAPHHALSDARWIARTHRKYAT